MQCTSRNKITNTASVTQPIGSNSWQVYGEKVVDIDIGDSLLNNAIGSPPRDNFTGSDIATLLKFWMETGCMRFVIRLA